MDWGPYQFRGLYDAWNCGVLWNSCDGSLYCNNCRFAVLVLRSALKQKNQLGMMMGFGCVMVLAIQFLLSLLANIGVSRFGQGAWCLFFGYGRSGQMVSAVLMGILLSIYRHQNANS